MRRNPVKTVASTSGLPTRRDVIRAAGAATLGLLAPPGIAQDDVAGEKAIAKPPKPAADVPWWLGPQYATSRVVEVRSARVLRGAAVEPYVLSGMIDQAVQQLTHAPTPEAAWRKILGKAERIVAKFNSVGANVIGTNEAFAKTLLERLGQAGYEASQIAVIEVSDDFVRRLGTRTPAKGWGKTIELGGRAEPLANYLLEADAVINVPVLKTHHIAGLSGCMKNLSHAVIRHPARYHANGCSPYVGQVIATAPVRDRLKLHLVNALRLVIDRGPDATPDNVAGLGTIFAAFDPVSLDHVGLATLEGQRRERGLTTKVDVPYLRWAGDAGLGRWRPAEIERITGQAD